MKTSDQVAGEARGNCAHCGAKLSAKEREFYGASCDRCETEIHRAFEEGREPILPPPSTVVKYLKARAERAEANARRLEKEIAALRAQPERGAGEIERAICRARCLRWELGLGRCVDEATHRSAPCQATADQFLLSWVGEAAAAIRALPLHPDKDEGGGR